MDMLFSGPRGEKVRVLVLVVGALLALFLAVNAVRGIMEWRYIGLGVAPASPFGVGGHGELFAVPDIATFTFAVVSDKPTVAAAQADATAKANEATAYLKDAGIDEKDIQTTDYSVSPRYEWQNSACPAGSGYCSGGRQALIGYEVRQTTTIKVRDTAKAGDLLAGVGGKGATEVSGLQFTFDDPQKVQAEARDKAIADAKQKANALARSLGVSLVRVVNFSESQSGQPLPVVYGMGAGAPTESKAIAPEISTGQNKVTDDVSITYEIR